MSGQFKSSLAEPPEPMRGPNLTASTHGHVLLTNSDQLQRYKDALQCSSLDRARHPPGSWPALRPHDTLSVPVARNGWQIGGQPIQLYVDGMRISTPHSLVQHRGPRGQGACPGACRQPNAADTTSNDRS